MNILCVPVGPLQANCYLVWDDAGAPARSIPGESRSSSRASGGEEGLHARGHPGHPRSFRPRGGRQGTGRAPPERRSTAPARWQPGAHRSRGLLRHRLSRSRPSRRADASRWSTTDRRVTVGELRPSPSSPLRATLPATSPSRSAAHLFCGDLLFYRSVGRTDFPGGDFPATAGLGGQAGRDAIPSETPVHPGHMESTTLGDELAHNPFLAGLKTDG